MEKQNVSIELSIYEELLNSKAKLDFVKRIVFSGDNRLTYDKKDIIFNINEQCVKLLFPEEYETRLKELLRGEE